MGHRVPVPSQQKVPGEPRDRRRRVPVHFPSLSPLGACLGKQWGPAAGLGGSASPRISQKTVSEMLFYPGHLRAVSDFGERSVGAGCQPGKRHGALMPCPGGVVGMRLPQPFLPGARPPPAPPGLRSPARKKGRGRPRCPLSVGRGPAPPPVLSSPGSPAPHKPSLRFLSPPSLLTKPGD